jgi:hypothetical protein
MKLTIPPSYSVGAGGNVAGKVADLLQYRIQWALLVKWPAMKLTIPPSYSVGAGGKVAGSVADYPAFYTVGNDGKVAGMS